MSVRFVVPVWAATSAIDKINIVECYLTIRTDRREIIAILTWYPLVPNA